MKKFSRESNIAEVKTKPINLYSYYVLSCPKCQCNFEYHPLNSQNKALKFYDFEDLFPESSHKKFLQILKSLFRSTRLFIKFIKLNNMEKIKKSKTDCCKMLKKLWNNIIVRIIIDLIAILIGYYLGCCIL